MDDRLLSLFFLALNEMTRATICSQYMINNMVSYIKLKVQYRVQYRTVYLHSLTRITVTILQVIFRCLIDRCRYCNVHPVYIPIEEVNHSSSIYISEAKIRRIIQFCKDLT